MRPPQNFCAVWDDALGSDEPSGTDENSQVFFLSGSDPALPVTFRASSDRASLATKALTMFTDPRTWLLGYAGG